MSSYTKGPLKIEPFGRYDKAIHISGSGVDIWIDYDDVDHDEAEANARRIVQCVNAHDDMYEALKSIPVYATNDGVWLNFRPNPEKNIGGAMFKIEGLEADVLKNFKHRVDAIIAKVEGAA